MMTSSEKTWWAPVWRGLVVDPEAKHYRRLKGALWLLLFLILHADRASGTFYWRAATVARLTKIPERTLQRWLGTLKRRGYVTVDEAGSIARTRILKWKTLRRGDNCDARGRQK